MDRASGSAEPADESRDQAVGRGIAAAAILLMAGTVLSRVLGLVREQLAAGKFGTGDEIAAFTVADNVATLVYDLLVSGMLQAALIPVLAQWAAPDAIARAELRRISGALLTVVLIAVGALAALGIAFAPGVVEVMTSMGGEGDARGAETVDLTVTMVRWIMPSTVLLCAAGVLMAILHAIGRVEGPSLALSARNAAVVVAILVASGSLGVKSLAAGSVAGAGAILILQIWPLARAGALPRPNLAIGHPAVREVMRLYGPVFAGLTVSTAAVVIDRNLAWGAGEDALGAMRYATTIVQMVLGVVAAAISLAALPSLSRHFGRGDESSYRATLDRAVRMTAVLILPATFGLAAIGKPVVDLLFRHGATGEAGAREILIALLGYLPGTLAAAFDQILIFACYARRDTKTPVVVGVLSVGIYFVVALALVQSMGMLGLVLANSAQWVGHALIMWWIVRRRIGPATGGTLWRTTITVTLAALAAAVAAGLVWLGLDAALPQTNSSAIGILRELGIVGAPVVVAGGIYVAILVVRGVEEMSVLLKATVGRVVSLPSGLGSRSRG
jgi:putative peptidoglycan lipid II flippase